jgi:hypothetical protein
LNIPKWNATKATASHVVPDVIKWFYMGV